MAVGIGSGLVLGQQQPRRVDVPVLQVDIALAPPPEEEIPPEEIPEEIPEEVEPAPEAPGIGGFLEDLLSGKNLLLVAVLIGAVVLMSAPKEKS